MACMHFFVLLALWACLLTPAMAEKEPMEQRVFKLPQSFMATVRLRGNVDAPKAGSRDPAVMAKEVEEFFKAQGVSFPQGAGTRLTPLTMVVAVTNTRDNLDLVEATLDWGCRFPSERFDQLLTVVEAPAAVFQALTQAPGQNLGDGALLAELLERTRQPASQVRVIGDAFIEGKSGWKVSNRAGLEGTETNHTVSTDVSPPPDFVGTLLESESTFSADGVTVSTSYSLGLGRDRQAWPPSARGGTGTDRFALSKFTATYHWQQGTRMIAQTQTHGTTGPTTVAFLTSRLLSPVTLFQPSSAVAVPKDAEGRLTSAEIRVPEGLLEARMQHKPLWKPGQTWLDCFAACGIPTVPGASVVVQPGCLQVVHTWDGIAVMRELINDWKRGIPASIRCQVQTVELPASAMRGLLLRQVSPDGALVTWDEVAARIQAGNGRIVHTSACEVTSGTRAHLFSGTEFPYLAYEGKDDDDDGRHSLRAESRAAGVDVEIVPTAGGTGEVIEVHLVHEAHPSLPQTFPGRASPDADAPVVPEVRSHVLRTEVPITLRPGQPHLVSATRPAASVEGADKDVIWATFLRCDITHALAPGVVGEPTPDGRMETRVFAAPYDFLSPDAPEYLFEDLDLPVAEIAPPDAAPAVIAGDPFGAPTAAPAPPQKKHGRVPLPPGASAAYDSRKHTLTVCNTPENLLLVEAVHQKLLAKQPLTVVAKIQIIEAPTAVLQQCLHNATPLADHAHLRDQLLTGKDPQVRLLHATQVMGAADEKGMVTLGENVPVIDFVEVDKQGLMALERSMKNVGLELEITPKRSADPQVLDLDVTMEFHPQPGQPQEIVIETRPGKKQPLSLTDFQTATLSTRTHCVSGRTRLLGTWPQPGTKRENDLSQALFITCEVVAMRE